ncbi:TnsD family Tn7-like transposition protein [Pseudomonas putida]|uniref:TnsD family Tn7-like transposition protein n=1 Tax=Pseudomonas putida TaxID=303 RepID=UPI0009B740AB|nr:TnsD family Tn7-like transposition protein [Pseudomonas putida]
MKHIFHLFPAAFPDETLHSVLSRYVRLCGFSTCNAAFCSEKAAASFSRNVAFPCRLVDLVEALPCGAGLDVSEIIKRHTLIPYYAPFLTHCQLDYALASMAGDGHGLKLKLGVVASRLEGASRIRFCPSCINDDVAEGGAAYWHRAHQLPGVLICPRHGTVLRVMGPGWSTNTGHLNLPGDESVLAHSVQPDIPHRCFSRLHRIALRSQQLLGAELRSLPADSMRSRLLGGAVKLNLASGSRLALRPLSRYLEAFFQALPDAWEYSVLGDFRGDLPPSWVTKLLRKPRGTHHPLKFIILAEALDVDLANLPSVGPVKVLEVQPPICDDIADRNLAPKLDIKPLAFQPVALWRLALAGEEAGAIAAELGVSQSYVYRTIRSVVGGPSAWMDARFLRERSERRVAFEADYHTRDAHNCRGYRWLYRRDKSWLSNLIAERGPHRDGRSDTSGMFALLDASLSDQIQRCAHYIRTLPGKPVRLSRTRIGRELHALSRFEKQLSKLPLCAAALASSCESSEAFRIRRLDWARAVLYSERRSITRSALYRTAGIRFEKLISE